MGRSIMQAKKMHRRHASTVEFSLSVFYPPLPSYEGSEEEKSPPLFVPPRHGNDALLWKRGRCVSNEHVGTVPLTTTKHVQSVFLTTCCALYQI
jgi:hypothetical protein